MANYYTEFSFGIDDLNDDEMDWLEAELARIDAADETDGPWPYSSDDEFQPGFTTELDREDHSLWIHSDESGTPEDAAQLVQAFLAAKRPAEAIGFEWANTCSSQRQDAFGGGALFITATDVRCMSSGQWLAQQKP